MYTELNKIKEQLFDAPVEVKQAFNSLVEYFDSKKGKGLVKFYLLKEKAKYKNLSDEEILKLQEKGVDIFLNTPSYTKTCTMKEAENWRKEMSKKDGVSYVLAFKDDYDGSYVIN